MPAVLRMRPSCTPVHLPMALQPSTQSWRGIWVREGSFFRSASENFICWVTQAVALLRPVGKAVGRHFCIVFAIWLAGAVRPECRRDILLREFTGERLRRDQQALASH